MVVLDRLWLQNDCIIHDVRPACPEANDFGRAGDTNPAKIKTSNQAPDESMMQCHRPVDQDVTRGITIEIRSLLEEETFQRGTAMSSNRNRLSLASALALMNLSLLGGCGDQSAPVAQSTPEPITTAKDDRAWLTRWGDYNMGPWTTDQLLADGARGRHSAKTLAWNPKLEDWKPLNELFPSASFTGSEEDGRRWTVLIEGINDSFDADQSEAFWQEYHEATGTEDGRPFVPGVARGSRVALWQERVRPMVRQVLALNGRFGPGPTSMTQGLRHALVLEASDAIARGDDESALQALEGLGSLGRQTSIGLFASYSDEGRAYDRKTKDESMTWQEHEDFAFKGGFAVPVHINGVLSTWNDWRTVPGAVDRLAACLDWIDLAEFERTYQAEATKQVRNNAPGWTVEDRARRHREIIALLNELRS